MCGGLGVGEGPALSSGRGRAGPGEWGARACVSGCGAGGGSGEAAWGRGRGRGGGAAGASARLTRRSGRRVPGAAQPGGVEAKSTDSTKPGQELRESHELGKFLGKRCLGKPQASVFVEGTDFVI